MEMKRIDVAENEVAKSSTNLVYAHKIKTAGNKKFFFVKLWVMGTAVSSKS
jgi:hypothetical protein